jgi:hypothetical protein
MGTRTEDEAGICFTWNKWEIENLPYTNKGGKTGYNYMTPDGRVYWHDFITEEKYVNLFNL